MARSQHLDSSITQQLTPKWAIGIDPLPGYLEPCLAEEIMRLVKDQLLLKAKADAKLGRAAMLTVETLYEEDLEG